MFIETNATAQVFLRFDFFQTVQKDLNIKMESWINFFSKIILSNIIFLNIRRSFNRNSHGVASSAKLRW